MDIRKYSVCILLTLVLSAGLLNTQAAEDAAEEEAERKAMEKMEETLKELSEDRRKEVSELLEKGMESFSDGKLKEAAGFFIKVLEIHPENETALTYLRKAKKLIERREQIEEKKKEEEKIREERQKRREERKEEKKEAQKKRMAEIHTVKGDEYYKSGMLKLAIVEYEQALAILEEQAEIEQKIKAAKEELQRRLEEAQSEKLASQLIRTGTNYFTRGLYKEAIEEFRKVLELLPGNHPDYDRAENWIHVAELYKTREEKKEAVRQSDISRRTSIAGVSETWLKRKRPEEKAEEGAEEEKEEKKESKLEEKAKQIVSVHFENAHIREVLSYLAEMSGVNIVLDEEVFPERVEPAVGEVLPEPAGAEPAPELIPRAGAPLPGPIPGRPLGLEAVGPSVTGLSPRVTIDLRELPLVEALTIILRAKNLQYRMEENLIWITTPERMAKERLITKIYTLLTAGTGIVEPQAPEAEEVGAGREEKPRLGEGEEGEEAVTEVQTIVDTLKKAVPWPPGSFIEFERRTSTLIVRNTPTSQGVIEELIRQIEGAPMQVSIEAKFITISMEELRQLGVEFPYLRVGLGSMGEIAVDRDAGSGIDFQYETEGFTEGEGITLSYTKLNPTQFQAVLDAIEKTDSANILSAPKVLTRNQQEAEIKVVNEYTFPGEGGWEIFYYVYFSETFGRWLQGATLVPTSFEEITEIGIMMTVTPDIGADMNITLSIVPTVNEWLGWIVYGITEVDPDAAIVQNFVQFANIFEQNIDTKVVVGDGETVVMGGLAQEREDESIQKVPLLGDIPILGRLFRRTSTSSDKSSLLIFVTTHLIKPTGERYRI